MSSPVPLHNLGYFVPIDQCSRFVRSRAACAGFEVDLTELNGEVDHIRLLVHYSAKRPVSGLVISLKGVSSRRLRRERLDIVARCWRGDVSVKG